MINLSETIVVEPRIKMPIIECNRHYITKIYYNDLFVENCSDITKEFREHILETLQQFIYDPLTTETYHQMGYYILHIMEKMLLEFLPVTEELFTLDGYHNGTRTLSKYEIIQKLLKEIVK